MFKNTPTFEEYFPILPENKFRCLHWDEHNETYVGLNSNLMKPDFPHNIRIRLAGLKFHFVAYCGSAKLRQINIRTQQNKSIWPTLFLNYEESLVSSNLNSKLFRFHCVRPSLHIFKKGETI